MITSTQPLYQPYQDKDGSPLEAGYLYFGTVSTNPETNPIAVYWDAAMTQPAVQPIRTAGGLPVRNGTPGMIYTNTNYSLTVRNKNLELVYTEQTSANTLFGFIISLLASTGTLLVSFIQAGAGAVLRTLESKLRDYSVNAADFGFSTTASAAVNSAAIQAALDSGAAVVEMNAGSFSYDTTILIDTNVRLKGAGSCAGGTKAQRVAGGATGQPGEGTTKLSYTGVSDAIHLIGSGTEGLENVHLSDFSLWGTVLAGNGIVVGTGVFITKSSLKDLHIRGFTNAAAGKGIGLYVLNCLETTFENIYAQSNNIGIDIYGSCTSHAWINCWARTNNLYGWNIEQLNGASFYQCLSEGNNSTGLRLASRNGQNVTQLDFYSFYTEADCWTIPGPAVEVRSIGTGATYDIRFWGGEAYEALDAAHANPIIALGKVSSVFFKGFTTTTLNAGFMTCQADTLACSFVKGLGNNNPAVTSGNVTGNARDATTGRWYVLCEDEEQVEHGRGTFTPTAVSGIAFAGPQGYWRRQDDMIDIWGNLIATSVTAGAVVIGGIPFTVGVLDSIPSAMLSNADDTHYILGPGTVGGSTMTFNWNTNFASAGTSLYFHARFRTAT